MGCSIPRIYYTLYFCICGEVYLWATFRINHQGYPEDQLLNGVKLLWDGILYLYLYPTKDKLSQKSFEHVLSNKGCGFAPFDALHWHGNVLIPSCNVMRWWGLERATAQKTPRFLLTLLCHMTPQLSCGELFVRVVDEWKSDLKSLDHYHILSGMLKYW